MSKFHPFWSWSLSLTCIWASILAPSTITSHRQHVATQTFFRYVIDRKFDPLFLNKMYTVSQTKHDTFLWFRIRFSLCIQKLYLFWIELLPNSRPRKFWVLSFSCPDARWTWLFMRPWRQLRCFRMICARTIWARMIWARMIWARNKANTLQSRAVVNCLEIT